MKDFDPNFNLRSYFQVKYDDVLDARASKLPPLEALPLSSTFGFDYTTISEDASWTQSQPQVQDSMITSSPLHEASPIANASDTSAISSKAVPITRARRGTSMEPRYQKRPERGDACASARVRLNSHDTFALAPSKSGMRYSKASVPSTLSPWSKSVLVRVKPDVDQTAQDVRYTFVRLPSSDVATCVAAVCAKVGIGFIPGMPVTWADSKTLLRGPLNYTFLQEMPDMQDFVITLVSIGDNGDVGLLLEM